MGLHVSHLYENKRGELERIIHSFENEGEDFVIGNRNKLKIFDLDGQKINIKSFKKPNLVNQIAYKYFRKSKAQRSFEYAEILLDKGIKTPNPVAFYENFGPAGIKDSYYASEQLNANFTLRALVDNDQFPDYENILRKFTKFTFDLHEKGIEFKDHSPGNTLIVDKNDGNYDFYLVDLNRMSFHSEMSFEQRIKNLARLSPHQKMIKIISDEYAKLYHMNGETFFDHFWEATCKFQYRFFRKKILKSKFRKKTK